MSIRRAYGLWMTPFECQLVRSRLAAKFTEGLDLDRYEAHAAFVKGGAEWLWRHYPDHVRALPPDLQLALIDDARLCNKRIATEMLAALFPTNAAGGSMVGLRSRSPPSTNFVVTRSRGSTSTTLWRKPSKPWGFRRKTRKPTPPKCRGEAVA